MKRYYPSIKRFSWVVLVCVLFMAVIGYALTKLTPLTYQVSTTLILTTDGPGNSFLPTVSSADGLSQATNYASEVISRQVMEYVYQSDPKIKKRGFAPDDLLANVTASTSPTAATILISATASDASDAVLLANDVAKGFQSYTQQQIQQQLDQQRATLQNQYNSYQKQNQTLETQILAINNSADPRVAAWTIDRTDIIHSMDAVQAQLLLLPATVNTPLNVIQIAKASDVTVSSKGTLTIVVAGMFGLLIGTGIMLILVFLEDRLRGEEQVKDKLGLAYLGGVSNDRVVGQNPSKVSNLVTRQYTDISANLRLTGILPDQWQAPKGVVLLITSVQDGEGKTTAAATLSGVLARAGYSVVVVDGNLRKPATHLAFSMNPAGGGLGGLLKNTGTPVDSIVQRSNVPGVWLLSGGMVLEDSALLLKLKMPDILAQLCQKTDVVIIDGPSILNGAEASILASMANGVALIVDTRRDKVAQLLRARELLVSLAHKPGGVIMNRLPKRGKNHYYAAAYSSGEPVRKPALVPVLSDPDYVIEANGKQNGQKAQPVFASPAVKSMQSSLMDVPPPRLVPATPFQNENLPLNQSDKSLANHNATLPATYADRGPVLGGKRSQPDTPLRVMPPVPPRSQDPSMRMPPHWQIDVPPPLMRLEKDE